MSNIEVVITDLDGTLFDLYPNVRASTKSVETLGRLYKKEVIVVPCTGRNFQRSLKYIEPLVFQNLGIFNGGATIFDIPKQECLHEQVIDRKIAQDIVRHFKDYAKWIGYGGARTAPANINLADVQSTLSIWAEVEECDLAKAHQFLSSAIGVKGYENRGTTGHLVGIDITHEAVDKGTSTLTVLERLGVAPENALAIGDGMNDKRAFEVVGLSVAMGNAPAALKAVADVTVGSLHEEGFSQAMEQYVL